MQRFILSLFCLILLGCKLPSSNQTYIDGTSLSIGLYIPMNGTIYGLQAINYLSGKKITISTNQEFNVYSNHSITNSSFGIFNIVDNNETKVGK